MGKKNLDWGNLPFGYMKTSKSFVATYKNGKWDEGKLDFTPTCPRELYNMQLRAMKEYLDILVIRAKFEDIQL